MEEEKGEWGFKAHKQMVKLEFKRGNYDAMMGVYKTMLTYIKSAVTRNYSEKVLNKILDLVSAPGGMNEDKQMELLHTFYETTLAALLEAKNDRLWFKTNLKLGKLWFDREEYGRLQKILKELQRSCQGPDGEDDPKKGTQLLEVYALEIQMHTATKVRSARTRTPLSPRSHIPLAPSSLPYTHTEQQEAQIALHEGVADQVGHPPP